MVSLWSWENKKLLVLFIFYFDSNYEEHQESFIFTKLHSSLKILEIVYNQVINEISENASSSKLENRNWFSQPLIHIVIGRSSGFPTSWKRYSFRLKIKKKVFEGQSFCPCPVVVEPQKVMWKVFLKKHPRDMIDHC